jgi:hypothetical protein
MDINFWQTIYVEQFLLVDLIPQKNRYRLSMLGIMTLSPNQFAREKIPQNVFFKFNFDSIVLIAMGLQHLKKQNINRVAEINLLQHLLVG